LLISPAPCLKGLGVEFLAKSGFAAASLAKNDFLASGTKYSSID
jgi:hypothetical protein